jgi:hypothetical protein
MVTPSKRKRVRLNTDLAKALSTTDDAQTITGHLGMLLYYRDSGIVRELTGRELKVLVILMTHADWQTGECWPGLALIGEEAGLHHKGDISKVLQALERKGIILTVREASGTESTLRKLIFDPVAGPVRVSTHANPKNALRVSKSGPVRVSKTGLRVSKTRFRVSTHANLTPPPQHPQENIPNLNTGGPGGRGSSLGGSGARGRWDILAKDHLAQGNEDHLAEVEANKDHLAAQRAKRKANKDHLAARRAKRRRSKADVDCSAAADQQHPPIGKIERALLDALEEILGYDVDPQQPDEDRQDYLDRLARKVNTLPKEDWDDLPINGCNWFNKANAGFP